MPCLPGVNCCSLTSSCSNLNCGPHHGHITDFSRTSMSTVDIEREIDVDSYCEYFPDKYSNFLSPNRSLSGGYIRFPSVSAVGPHVPSADVINGPSMDMDSTITDSGYSRPSISGAESSFQPVLLQVPENSPTSRPSDGGSASTSYLTNSSSTWVASPARFCLLHMNSDSPCSVTTGLRSSVSGSNTGNGRRQGLQEEMDITYLEPLGMRPPCVGQERTRLPCIGQELSPPRTRAPVPPPARVQATRAEDIPTSDPHSRIATWLADTAHHQQRHQRHAHRNHHATADNSHSHAGYLKMNHHRSLHKLPPKLPTRPNTLMDSIQEDNNQSGYTAIPSTHLKLHLRGTPQVDSLQNDNSTHNYRGASKPELPNRFDLTATSDATDFMKFQISRPSVTKRLTPSRHRFIVRKLKKIGKHLHKKGHSKVNLETLAIV